MKLVFLGPPGGGKGTQANLIAEKFGLQHISTGDLLRNNIKQGTDLGQRAEKFIGSGGLVPDDLIIEMTLTRLSEEDCKKGYILDGFPRTLEQAKKLEGFTSIDRVIDIEVGDEFIVDRVTKRLMCSCGESYHLTLKPPQAKGICDKCGGKLFKRDDDNEKTVRKRLRVYKEQTEPLIAFFEQKGLVSKVDGQAPIAEVTEQIVDALKELH